jgi:hypothetical protein
MEPLALRWRNNGTRSPYVFVINLGVHGLLMQTAIDPAVVAMGLLVRLLCTGLLAGVNVATLPTTTRLLETPKASGF